MMLSLVTFSWTNDQQVQFSFYKKNWPPFHYQNQNSTWSKYSVEKTTSKMLLKVYIRSTCIDVSFQLILDEVFTFLLGFYFLRNCQNSLGIELHHPQCQKKKNCKLVCEHAFSFLTISLHFYPSFSNNINTINFFSSSSSFFFFSFFGRKTK